MFIPKYIHTHRECEWGNFPNLFLISFHSHSNALAFQACFFGISGELHHSPHTCHVLRHSRWVSYALWACWPLGGISQDLNIKHPIKVDEPYLTSQSTMECQLQLVQTTACHLRSFLERAMKLQCNGYLVNHPSQLQHECLILSGEDRIRFCLDQALLLVNWGQGKKDFDQKWTHTRFYDKVWHQTLWTYGSWYEQLLSAVLTQHSPDIWIMININTSYSTFTLQSALTMNELNMAYHIPSEQYSC